MKKVSCGVRIKREKGWRNHSKLNFFASCEDDQDFLPELFSDLYYTLKKLHRSTYRRAVFLQEGLENFGQK